jgi:hypothetical protein
MKTKEKTKKKKREEEEEEEEKTKKEPCLTQNHLCPGFRLATISVNVNLMARPSIEITKQGKRTKFSSPFATKLCIRNIEIN